MKEILIGLAMFFLAWFVAAFALSLSVRLTRAWVQLYTSGLHKDLRDVKRDDALAFMESLQDDLASEGYSPHERALHLLINLLRGMPWDLAWRLNPWGISMRERRNIDWHLAHGGVVGALEVGKFHLNRGDPRKSLPIFLYIHSRVSEVDTEHYYIVLGNIAYAHNRLGNYEVALKYLESVEEHSHGGARFFAWHAIARAYALFKTEGKTDKYWAALRYAQNRPEYNPEARTAHDSYSEIAEDIVETD